MYHQFTSPKALSLLALTVQNTVMTILMRLSTDDTAYLVSVAVMMDEAVKLIFSLMVLSIFYMRSDAADRYSVVGLTQNGMARVTGRPEIIGWLLFLEAEVFESVSGFVEMSIPAVCYAVQKNLSFFAITCVSPAMYQILFQFKLLTTAAFSYLMLNKQFTFRQKFSLGILFVGVALTEVSSLEQPNHDDTRRPDGILQGSLAILLACIRSGFSAVYIEKSIKRTMGGHQEHSNPHTVWVRNVQLSTFGLMASLVAALVEDKHAVDANGLFQGFTPLVWAVVLLSSFGGIVIALVMKYADNILKNFATAVSIISTSAVSAIFFGLSMSFLFIAGSLLVLVAVYMYSSGQPVAAPVVADNCSSDEIGDVTTSQLTNIARE